MQTGNAKNSHFDSDKEVQQLYAPMFSPDIVNAPMTNLTRLLTLSNLIAFFAGIFYSKYSYHDDKGEILR